MTIDDVLQRIPAWRGAGPVATRLNGGITNQNYRVTVAGESFVVRIPGRDTAALGIDRERERACTAAAAGLGIGPEVAPFPAPPDILITRFIPGQPVEAVTPALLARIGTALARVHAGPAFPGVFRPFATVIDYLRRCGPDAQLPEGFASLLSRAETVDRALRATAPPDRPCHNDLLLANVIDDGRELRILDWEYAAMGDPWFDLGNFAANQELDEPAERLLLAAYAGEATEAALARLSLMRVLSDLREAMWGQLQLTLSELDFDFAGYARRHFDRCAAALADSGLPARLSLVQGGDR